jgi:hypothetical protein
MPELYREEESEIAFQGRFADEGNLCDIVPDFVSPLNPVTFHGLVKVSFPPGARFLAILGYAVSLSHHWAGTAYRGAKTAPLDRHSDDCSSLGLGRDSGMTSASNCGV